MANEFLLFFGWTQTASNDKTLLGMSFNLEWVYLRLPPYRQLSLRPQGFNKLSPRFFGPFQILQKLGPVAYKLALSSDFLLHLVFHVSCLKKKLGAQITPIPTLPPVDFTSFLQPNSLLKSQSSGKVKIRTFLPGSLSITCSINSLTL